MAHCFVYLIGTFLFLVATLLGWFGTWYCRYVDQVLNGTSTQFGLFNAYQGGGNLQDQCILPQDITTQITFLSFDIWADAYLNVARGCGATANVLSALCSLLLWCGLCCGHADARGFRSCMGGMACACALLQGFEFLILLSDLCNLDGAVCTLDFAATLNIVSIAIFVVAGFVCCCVPEIKDDGDGLY
mmetsp:Transcript_18577/g.27556  ORF Transcript_18577/g.27556 Transcript_18577/m.27556 type:complete len:188 (+) Transcript_18577:96-659(+)|eukprot:CAMPEP_0194211182 /NCGR_PEP_ID=MMETSP0156-20130528/9753_1 /TAXON_ID=33649 /ORGANISM="Thalassionema nitzschioides, Strain L26-B" /LENGTH=187 /DNA_ID=CAMNT_0038938667 /DNA_START=51 /DNA_END=614 /DNA_ORIENTATION=+